MPRLGDYEAWIDINGKRLEEYAVESKTEELEIRCWIPSEEGKNFIVHYRDYTKSRTSLWKLHADGRLCGGKFTMPNHHHVAVSGKTVSTTEQRLYQFGRDEDLALQDESLIKALGTLKIRVEEGHVVRIPFPDWRSRNTTLTIQPVHEQAKKAAGHCVVGGALVKKKRTQIADFKPFGRKSTSFIFQHGPREFLQAKGIIPVPEHVPHVSNEREEENNDPRGHEHGDHAVENNQGDSDDEKAADAEIQQLQASALHLDALAKALRNRDERQGKRPVVKREDGERAPRRVKMEIEPNRLFRRGEVIDLT
ncbi:hypothetical protein CALCODRAFT_517302 [Calocera cornea HHB12733]|uniref:DUF7918 domain-containing protein n=1 Tax=Calocera cornea HHB12733 TaxID=1353952 RepID=A0A165G5W9_9BASI|nr:hypothetical protein CALCODRAFT_517302 [Calocera cornea HHB12733]